MDPRQAEKTRILDALAGKKINHRLTELCARRPELRRILLSSEDYDELMTHLERTSFAGYITEYRHGYIAWHNIPIRRAVPGEEPTL